MERNQPFDLPLYTCADMGASSDEDYEGDRVATTRVCKSNSRYVARAPHGASSRALDDGGEVTTGQ